jgi:GTP-binding protein HflX
MTKKALSLTHYLPKVLLLGVNAPYNRTNIDSYFQEFRNLAKTNGVVYQDEMYIKIRAVDPTYFFTEGKLAELSKYCVDNEIKEVVLSEALTSLQERNLRDALHCPVFDRTQLILEIFEKAAHSSEGKTQVAIAMLRHQKTRMAGKGIHMSQQAGGIGMRGGPGETAKEKEKRHIENTMLKLQKQLDVIQRTRETQRKKRLNSAIKQICLIGYTNAGKSTILNALTKSDVVAEDKLFCTLDTTTRELFINGTKKGVLSDTVGFIQQLPHQLIEAFKSTLSELEYADLLLHVIDISDPNWQNHITVVNDILHELQVDKPILYVFNKNDAYDASTESDLMRYQPHVRINALSKEGLQPLVAFLDAWQ